jgi:hypothetical protein
MRQGLLIPDEAATSHVGGLVQALDQRKAEEVCVAGFRSLQAGGIAPSDKRNSGDYLPRLMTEQGLGCGFGKSELAKAMNRLMGRGTFVRGVVGRYSNRNPKEGLVLKTEGAE